LARSPIARVKIEVTPEMIEVARDIVCDGQIWEASDHQIAECYRRMRALEPGDADPGVMQHDSRGQLIQRRA